MHARRANHLSIVSPSTSARPPAALLTPRTPHSALFSRSPPPSPGLPPPPRHAKASSSAHARIVKKLLAVFCSLTVLAWFGIRHWCTSRPHAYQGEYEMVGDSLLPEEPSVVAVTDPRGKMLWTLSLPAHLEFPLRPIQYQELCRQVSEVSLADQRGYYYTDPNFVDVQEAMEQGLLPQSQEHVKMVSAVGWDEHAMGVMGSEEVKLCETSLTFVMETSEAGMGKTLMSLWMAYGLAQKEGRAFFVDDTRWPYGNYTSYFAPPPAPSCLPPLTNQVVPCPHNARHLLVSAATTSWTFGSSFNEEYQDTKKSAVQRQHRIFGLLRQGYEALFNLRHDDAGYVLERAQNLYSPVQEGGNMSIGLHVRRGDRHPFELEYSKDYIPLDRYLFAARDVLVTHHGQSLSLNASSTRESKAAAASGSASNVLQAVSSTGASLPSVSSKIILASDDPDVYSAVEVGDAIRAQDRIVLASKTTLEATGAKNKNRYIDEISGWEGGFFRDVFWSLGKPSKVALDVEKNLEASQEAMRMRELVGRSYLLDLAVLAKADTVLCTVSATGCRLLAVMMGWEKSVEQVAWRNIDGPFYWSGIEYN
ncbi:uncharacterized protein K452DRAFT_326597 [Aplosporella prunicola CBS 121167]|uniref:Glycosyltransferase family 23 protein n=1 Tax=Aplosporella prunicola CBS 121167 TaxID=1176127 RepID=A0A6A6BGR3_9PEZI|nr:uncharacterized protein K452DRAFT_326597 [Aplosporella prunicola CBS 121167]KAF2142057.1 hypothetical protein K452DRAFT_326597 [Aplosporella prunicola CBS 121167]